MNRRILIVDDMAVDRRILKGALCWEYDVLEASDGKEALALLRREHETVSAVLLDVVMPGLDGFEVLRAIRADSELAVIPVIIITGHEDDEARNRALAMGAKDFVMKPYNPDVIKHCLRNNIALRETTAAMDSLRRDRLTGLYEREAFFVKVKELVAAGEPGHYIMACFDVDKFKVINDQYGLRKGDEVLQHIAGVFDRGFSANGGICCRVSADDFAVLYPAAFKDSEEIAELRRQAGVIEGLSAPIVFSIGRYLITDLSMSPSAMYDRAMLAAESVKGRYDAQIASYDESMRDHLIHEQEIVTEMEAALKAGQFEVWFQPQYNHATGALIGSEALVRWRHPQKGLIAPGDFIPIFEQNGFVYALDKYVWEEVCRFLRKGLDEGASPLPVSVNISRYDAMRPDLVSVICELVRRYEVPVELLRLEITESAFAEPTRQIVTVVKSLIDLGFTLEIDDFGSGYSSLNTLKDVPTQVVKLDMRFFEDGDDSQRSGSIVESVIRMTKWLGMSVIAEGVELKAQADFLRSIGCNYVQGYLYSRPVTAENYMQLCRENVREEKLISLETVETFDSSAFWDPKSMDTIIFNSFVGGACIFEYHNGRERLLRVNDKYIETFGAGLSRENVFEYSTSDYMDKENRDILFANIERAIETGAESTCETCAVGMYGVERPLYIRSTVRMIARTGDRYLMYCTVLNVTDRRESERKLVALNERLQAIVGNIESGVTAVIFNDDATVEYIFVTDRYYQLLGYTKEQFADEVKDPLCAINEEDRPDVLEKLKGLTEIGRRITITFRAIRRDGREIWLRDVLTLMRFAEVDRPVQLSVFSDVTDEVLFRQELLDNLPCGAGVYEFKDGELSLTYQNKSYWELVGLNEASFPDEEPMSAINPEDVPAVMAELSAALEQGRDVSCDVRLRHLTLGYQAVRLAGRIVRQKSGGFLIYATFTPISDEELLYQKMLPQVLSAVMENSTDLSFAKDRDLRYICASRAFAEMAGLDDERCVVGKTDFDIFSKDFAEKLRADELKMLEDGEFITDMVEPIPSEDGTPRYASTSKYLLRDTMGNVIGLYGVGRDITKVLETDSQLKFLNNSIPGGLAVFVYSPDGIRINYCNDGFCRLFGGTREGFEARGDLDPMEWVLEEDRQALLEQTDALLRGGTFIDCVFRVHVLGGGFKWINHKAVAVERHGESATVNAVLLDVTEQQETLERLRMSEEESLLARELSDNIVCRFTVADRSLTTSREVAEKTGRPERIEDVPYGPVRAGTIAPESEKTYVDFYEGILHGKKRGSAVFRSKQADGWGWLEAQHATIFSGGGEPVAAVVSFKDVTERLESEAAYTRWQQSLADRKKETYTLFRCNISKNTSFDSEEGSLLHINYREGNLSFDERTIEYAEQCIYPEDVERYITFLKSDTLLANFYRGKRSDTLEYREIVPDGDFRWLRLNVDMFEYPNSKDVEADLMFENIDEEKRSELLTLERAETDPLTGVLNRAAFGSRVNAYLREMKPGVRCAMLMLDIDGFKQVNDVFGHGAGDRALIDVAETLRSALRRDDLLGRLGGDEFLMFLGDIPGDDAAAGKAQQICALTRRAFSRNVRISGSVGIVIAPRDGDSFEALYKKVDAALYNVKGAGKDSFAFYCENRPGEESGGNGAPEAEGAENVPEKKLRVLIVDDNTADNELIANMLKNDFVIERANDGNSALIRLRHAGAAVSVVLLDLLMPGMDGFAVLEKLQESAELQNIPVIVVSGDEDRETCLRALTGGATDFVTKPVNPELLRIRIRAAISKAEERRIKAKNFLLEMRNDERLKYEAALEGAGIVAIEYDWITGDFVYHPSISKHLAGNYDQRRLWHILLSDRVADTATVKRMQALVHKVAENRVQMNRSITIRLKTPSDGGHMFRMNVRKLMDEYQLTNKIIITLLDMQSDDNA